MPNDLENILVISWDGHAINNGTNYVCGVRNSGQWGLPGVKVNTVQRDGARPVVGGVSFPEEVIELSLGIEDLEIGQRVKGELTRRW